MLRILKKVEVRNFRIFGSEGRSFDFGGGFTQIIANNGAGKTSLWLAMLIGLGGKVPLEVRRLGDDGLIHFPQIEDIEKAKRIQETTTAEIKIVLNNESKQGGRQFFELDPIANEVIIEVLIPPINRPIKYRVNGINWQKLELKQALKRAGVNSDDPLLFLKQFKAISLLTAGPVGLLSALEDSLGIWETRNNLEEALESYEQSKTECKEQRIKVMDMRANYASMKEKYELYIQYQKLNEDLAVCEDELNVRKLIDAEEKLEDIRNVFETKKFQLQNLVQENENITSGLTDLRAKKENYTEKHDDTQKLFTKTKEEIQQLKANKKQYSDKLIEIEEELKEINILKNINHQELQEQISSLEDDYLNLKVKEKELNNNYRTLKDEISELQVGKSGGSKETKNFVTALKKKGFKAELLINSLSCPDNIKEDIIYFESVLGDLKWSVVIFKAGKRENEIIKIAKNVSYRGYIIFLEEEYKDKFTDSLTYLSLNVKVRLSKLKDLIKLFLKDFSAEKTINLSEGIFSDKFGTKVFILKPEELFMDKKARIALLRKKIITYQSEIKKLKPKAKDASTELQKQQKLAQELSRVEKEDKLLEERDNYIILIQKTQETIKERDQLEKDCNILLKKIFEDVSKVDQNIGKFKENLSKNRELFNELTQEKKEKMNQINKQENQIQLLTEENSAVIELKIKFPQPRSVEVLNSEISNLKQGIQELGKQDPSIEAKFKTLERNLSNAISTLEELEKDLSKHISTVKTYNREYSEFVENVLKTVRINFSQVLKRIEYDGQLNKKLYEKKRRIWNEIEDNKDIELTSKMAYGIDIKIKKPKDKRFHKFFDPKGQKISYRHSGGQTELIMLAFLIALQRSFKSESKFYVVDEPTPHMDTANTSKIMQLFGESLEQIILFTPRPMPVEYANEVIALGDTDIKKIPEKLLETLKNKNIETGDSFQARREI